MKKAILPAMIASLLATSAQAATVYNADGTTADVYGRMQFDIRDDGTDGTDTDAGTNGFGSARMGFKATSAINSDINAIAKGEWQVEAENSGDNEKQFKVRHLYAGFDSAEMGSLIFGQTDTAFYQAVAATDLYNTYGYSPVDGIDPSRQEGQIIYTGNFAGVYVGASYQFQQEDYKTNIDLDDGYALTLGYNIADVAVYGGYLLEEFANAEDKENYALSASYALDDLYLAAVFAKSNQNVAGGPDNDLRGYDLFASYYLADATKVYGGYGLQENTDTNEDTFEAVTLGAEYAFNNQLKTWIEYEADMISGNDDAVTVALQYNF